MFEMSLACFYTVIIALHIAEYTGTTPLRDAVANDVYNSQVTLQIRNNGWRVNFIGFLASLTLVEWLVWMSKMSRTFSVLFMIVEDMFVRLLQFLVFFFILAASFGITRYVMFGNDVGTYGLTEYLVSPFKEINGERAVNMENLSRMNEQFSLLLDTVFILLMVLLLANLLIAFMADAYGDMMQTGNARYAYNQFEAIKLARFAGHSGMAPLGVADEKHPMGKIAISAHTSISFQESFGLNKDEDHKAHEGFKKKCCTFAVMRGFQY
jgi:hypothetical protein